jgi:hypothetical protein
LPDWQPQRQDAHALAVTLLRAVASDPSSAHPAFPFQLWPPAPLTSKSCKLIPLLLVNSHCHSLTLTTSFLQASTPCHPISFMPNPSIHAHDHALANHPSLQARPVHRHRLQRIGANLPLFTSRSARSGFFTWTWTLETTAIEISTTQFSNNSRERMFDHPCRVCGSFMWVQLIYKFYASSRCEMRWWGMPMLCSAK